MSERMLGVWLPKHQSDARGEHRCILRRLISPNGNRRAVPLPASAFPNGGLSGRRTRALRDGATPASYRFAPASSGRRVWQGARLVAKFYFKIARFEFWWLVQLIHHTPVGSGSPRQPGI
jgi:hypothetical protein